MRKRIWGFVLVFCTLMSFVPITASAVESGKCGNNLTWTLDNGILVINGIGDMKIDWYHDFLWNNSKSDVTSLIINDGVTSIDEQAFSDLNNLTSVSLPNSLTSIGRLAFWDCSSLENIILPNSVISIGDSVFSGCSNLVSATLSENLKSINQGVFGGCSSLKNVSLPNGISNIGDRAFAGCESLESITLPDGITTIEEYAFKDCSNLKNITLPNSLTNIDKHAFDGCMALTEIALPDSLTNIGEYAFANCGLINITLPNSLTSTGDYTFYWCHSLESVTLPDGLNNIGEGTFWYCDSLQNITMPNTLNSIGNSAFYICDALENITLPDSLTNIGDKAFNTCRQLKNVVIPDSVTYVGDMAFMECNNLTNIDVSSGNITYKSLDGVLFSFDMTELVGYPCGRYGSYTVPDSVKYIREGALHHCSFSPIILPSSVVSIGENPFAFGFVENITVDENNEHYLSDQGVLFNRDQTVLIRYPNKSAEEYTIPDSVTRIGGNAFNFCELLNITLPRNVTAIGEYAFAYSRNLTSVVLPADLKKIGAYAFLGCEKLTDIYYAGSQEDWNNIEGHRDITDATIHYNSAVFSPDTPILPAPETTVTDNGDIWHIEVTAEKTYINSFVYAAAYDEDGSFTGLVRVPLETDGSTGVDIEKNDNTASAKIFIWTDKMQPVTETRDIDL